MGFGKTLKLSYQPLISKTMKADMDYILKGHIHHVHTQFAIMLER